jgi:hypothetical protein
MRTFLHKIIYPVICWSLIIWIASAAANSVVKKVLNQQKELFTQKAQQTPQELPNRYQIVFGTIKSTVAIDSKANDFTDPMCFMVDTTTGKVWQYRSDTVVSTKDGTHRSKQGFWLIQKDLNLPKVVTFNETEPNNKPQTSR